MAVTQRTHSGVGVTGKIGKRGRGHSPRRFKAFRRNYLARPPWIVVTNLFFGLGWLRAAVSKVIDPAWWSGEIVATFVASHESLTLDWFRPILALILLTPAVVLASIVLTMQAIVGLCLLVKARPAWALSVGIAMNLAFVAIGAVNPSVFYLIGQGSALLWILSERQRFSNRAPLVMTAVGATFAAFNVPFVASLHPAAVSDDPAIIMVTLGALAAVAAGLTSRRSPFRQ